MRAPVLPGVCQEGHNASSQQSCCGEGALHQVKLHMHSMKPQRWPCFGIPCVEMTVFCTPELAKFYLLLLFCCCAALRTASAAFTRLPRDNTPTSLPSALTTGSL